jgi:hypothetical protein
LNVLLAVAETGVMTAAWAEAAKTADAAVPRRSLSIRIPL